MVVFFLILHIIICILLTIGMWLHILKAPKMVMMLAWFVPVWGILCVIVLDIRVRFAGEYAEEVGVEKLKINDEIHRSILMEEDPTEGRVVPLEEALLINDTATRRQLMMEIMYSNPDDYVSQLQDARMNDDTEVVHYAVTALVELQKEYDLQFQEMERKMEENPDDEDILFRYLELVEQYLDSGLLEGNTRNIQLRVYSDLLEKKLKTAVHKLPLYEKKIEADLMVGEYERAYQDIEKVLYEWPNDESGYLFLIQYYALVKNRTGIDQVLAQIRRRKLYLSPKGRNVVKFWEKES